MNPSTDAEGKPFECYSAYAFTARGQRHDVYLEHKAGVWRIMMNGAIVLTKKHNKSNPLTSAKHSLELQVKTGLPDGDLQAIIQATWVVKSTKWAYECSVKGTVIEARWTKQGGDAGQELVEVLGPPQDVATAPVPENPIQEAPAQDVDRNPAPAPEQSADLAIEESVMIDSGIVEAAKPDAEAAPSSEPEDAAAGLAAMSAPEATFSEVLDLREATDPAERHSGFCEERNGICNPGRCSLFGF